MIRPELKYGLIAGGGVALWFLIEYFLGFHTTHLALGEQSGRFSILVLLVALWLLLKKKQEAFGPLFNLRRGLWSGMFTSFIAAMIIYIFLALYGQFINPGWVEHALIWKVEQMRIAHVPEEEIRRHITFFRQSNGPVGLIQFTLISWTLQGSLISFFITVWFNWQGQKAK